MPKCWRYLKIGDHPGDRADRRRRPRGETFNINADTVAGAVAGAVKAERLLLLTDVEGVLDQEKKLIHELTVAEARALIADGTISGGMIPKIETAIEAVESGVDAAVILDGRIPHALLLELFTEQAPER